MSKESNVVSLMDRLAESSPHHAALCRVLERPRHVPAGEEHKTEFVAQWILSGLWMEGYKVVPIDEDEEEE